MHAGLENVLKPQYRYAAAVTYVSVRNNRGRTHQRWEIQSRCSTVSARQQTHYYGGKRTPLKIFSVHCALLCT